MSTQNLKKPHLLLILGGLLAGIAGTAAVMSLNRPSPPVTGPSAETASQKDEHGHEVETGKEEPGHEEPGHKDEHGKEEAGHEGEHVLIKLTPEAVKTAGIRLEAARLAPVGESLSAPGTVEVSPNRAAKITPPAPGKIVRLLADLGQTVRAGQPLAVLDSFEVAQAHAAERQAEANLQQARATLQTAQAETAQARAGVRQAEAEVQQARTKQASAETALERQRELASAGVFSQPTLQAAQAELSEAQSQLLQAQTDLQSHLIALQRAERLFKEELISRAELEQAQLENRQDQSRVEQAKSRVAIATQTLEREKRVFSGDLLTRREVQTAEAEVRTAQGDVLRARQGVLRAQQDVRKAEKDVQAARTALRGAESGLRAVRSNLYALEGTDHTEGSGGLLTLKAPITGVVTERNPSIGEAVERTSTLFVIENLNTVLVNANVPEKDVARVQVGQPVEVTVPAYPDHRLRGVVQSIAGRVDEKTRALAVRCLVENPEGRLRPDMFARVFLGIGARQNALTVPVSALDEQNGKQVVYVEEDGGYEKREVGVGRTTGGRAEILSGVKPGERVVVNGVFVLKSEARKDELKGHEH